MQKYHNKTNKQTKKNYSKPLTQTIRITCTNKQGNNKTNITEKNDFKIHTKPYSPKTHNQRNLTIKQSKSLTSASRSTLVSTSPACAASGCLPWGLVRSPAAWGVRIDSLPQG